jgi:hypothetical protein
MNDPGTDRIAESHDRYGKRVMRAAFGERFREIFTEIDYGAGRPARIDGTLDQNIAVEVESRVSKQVRGAVLDLICHSYPKKLLVLLPVHMSDVAVTARQCESILSKFLDSESFRVVVLTGCGSKPCFESDVAVIQAEVEKWLGKVVESCSRSR